MSCISDGLEIFHDESANARGVFGVRGRISRDVAQIRKLFPPLIETSIIQKKL